MSIGKAYRHRTYLNINSTSFHYHLHLKEDLPFEIPYLPVGLFFGQHKVMGKLFHGFDNDHHDDNESYSANLNHVSRGCLSPKKLEIFSRYLKNHKDGLIKESEVWVERPNGRRFLHQRNWFLPISAGGLGILPPDGWKFYIRPIDRTICKNLYKYTYDRCPSTTQRPLPGYELEKYEPLASVPWSKKDEKEKAKGLIKLRTETRCSKSRCRQEVLFYDGARQSLLY